MIVDYKTQDGSSVLVGYENGELVVNRNDDDRWVTVRGRKFLINEDGIIQNGKHKGEKLTKHVFECEYIRS